MSKVLPPPILVVRERRTPRRWRWTLVIAVLWIASLAALPYALRYAGVLDARATASRVSTEHDALLQKVAVAERAEQVARAANADLQQSLRDRQEEIAGLRADLAFYSKLTDGRSKPEGLAVHGIRVKPDATPRLYDFTVTLTQTLKSGQIANGRVRVSLNGIDAGKLATVAWQQLAPNQAAAGLPFSFKYFQQVSGSVMLPEGFTPNRILVDADAGSDMGRAEQEFAWADALNNQEPANVQQQQD